MPSTSFSRCFCALLCAFALLPCRAQNTAATWKIEFPYPDNPLKHALLSGDATYAGLTTKAELQLECRPDADGPRINLVFTPKQVRFDADPFEGPGGLGERRPLRISLGKNVWSRHFSGYYVDSESFVFSFALPLAAAREITSTAEENQALAISVDSAKGGSPLEFHFTLPSASETARKMVAPCLGHPRKS